MKNYMESVEDGSVAMSKSNKDNTPNSDKKQITDNEFTVMSHQDASFNLPSQVLENVEDSSTLSSTSATAAARGEFTTGDKNGDSIDDVTTIMPNSSSSHAQYSSFSTATMTSTAVNINESRALQQPQSDISSIEMRQEFMSIEHEEIERLRKLLNSKDQEIELLKNNMRDAERMIQNLNLEMMRQKRMKNEEMRQIQSKVADLYSLVQGKQ
mgnify:FL=1